MPDPIKIQVAGPDGKPFEAVLPDGFLPVAQVEKEYIPRAAHNSEFSAFRTRTAAELREGLLKDDEFKKNALGTWGIDLAALEAAAGGKGKKLSEEDLQKLRQEIDTKEIQPLREENQTLMGEVEYGHELQMQRAVIDACIAAGVDPEYLKPGPNGVPLAISWFTDAIVYDTEQRAIFAADPKTGEPRLSGKRRAADEHPYMTAQELVDEFVATNPKILVNNKQRGSNFQTPPKGGGGGGGSPDEIDGSDIRAFGQNLKAIAEGKVKVRIPGVVVG